jgi:hypothetical protein
MVPYFYVLIDSAFADFDHPEALEIAGLWGEGCCLVAPLA